MCRRFDPGPRHSPTVDPYAPDVKRVLLTGMSGTGKSTVVTALAALGYKAIDVDAPAWSELTAFESADLSGLGAQQDWTWREARVSQLLAKKMPRCSS